MKIEYQTFNFKPTTLEVIKKANVIIDELRAQGFTLTLRQLYYQFVRRNWLVNSETSYDNLGNTITNARLAGMIDWEAIEDRTRSIKHNAHWDSPQEILGIVAKQFRLDKWASQPAYIEVWIEKEALVGIIEDTCRSNDVPYFACRGYASASEIWRAGMRFRERIELDKECYVLYLGDHDPSGIDMPRDAKARLDVFTGGDHVHVERLALNMSQIEEFDPPPNPAKMTDGRASGYVEKYGASSWELDALEPTTILGLIENRILELRDEDAWAETCLAEEVHRDSLHKVAVNWDHVIKFLPKPPPVPKKAAKKKPKK